MVFQNTNVFKKFFRLTTQGGLPKVSGYYREGGVPSPLLVVMLVTKKIPVLVELVFGLHHGDSRIFGSRLGTGLPRN
jgi:hypothetical protein